MARPPRTASSEPISPTSPPRAEGAVLGYYKALLDFFKACLWPALVLLVLVKLEAPLLDISRRIPQLLDRSNVISLGGLKLELPQQLSQTLPQGVPLAVNGLSADGLQTFLETPPNKTAGIMLGTDHAAFVERREAYAELVRRGLVLIERMPGADKQSDKHFNQLIKLTPLGDQAKDAVVKLLLGQTQSSPKR